MQRFRDAEVQMVQMVQMVHRCTGAQAQIDAEVHREAEEVQMRCRGTEEVQSSRADA